MVDAVLSRMQGSGDPTLSIPGVFQMLFSFRWLFWVTFEEGQQTESARPCLTLIRSTWSLVQQHG